MVIGSPAPLASPTHAPRLRVGCSALKMVSDHYMRVTVLECPSGCIQLIVGSFIVWWAGFGLVFSLVEVSGSTVGHDPSRRLAFELREFT